MGERVPLIRQDTGATVGHAVVMNGTDPIAEFNALTRIDGVLVGLVITDRDTCKAIQGNIGAVSIAAKSTAEMTAEFTEHLRGTDGKFMARGMQDEVHDLGFGDIYNPDKATQHVTRFIPNQSTDGFGEFISGAGD